MDEILVTLDKTAEEYVSEAKEKNEVAIKGKGRDTVKAVDVAEILKIDGAKVKNIKIETEELEKEGKKVRVSNIQIEVEK